MNSQELLLSLQAGDGQAATEIFDRYVQRLVALAQSRIGAKLGRRIDGEDIVQSTFRSFFVHASNNEYALTRSGDLWRLLASIAIHKLQGQIERQTAARRTIGREDAAGETLLGETARVAQPTPEEVLATIEQWELATDRLTELEQTALAARLRGDSIDRIAASLEKSPRTVRRALAHARLTMERELLGGDEGDRLDDVMSTGEADPLVQLAYADFTLERLLGAGGMGKVYRATQQSTGKTVAVKALQKARQSDRRAVEKFVEEARILARLDHPGIVRLHGLGRFPGGGFFIVMDFIAGADLQVRLERGPLTVDDAVSVVIAAAEAIDHAHGQGIVHGDVKPANVLVDRDQRVVVTDFGLAQIMGEGAGRSGRRRVIGGTEGFMAPEVREGAMPTPAADIYGLGALLGALVTGRPPGGAGAGGLGAEFGAPLGLVLGKCLAGDPRGRFGSARELVEALKLASRGQT